MCRKVMPITTLKYPERPLEKNIFNMKEVGISQSEMQILLLAINDNSRKLKNCLGSFWRDIYVFQMLLVSS